MGVPEIVRKLLQPQQNVQLKETMTPNFCNTSVSIAHFPDPHIMGLNQFTSVWSCLEMARKIWHFVVCKITPLYFFQIGFLKEV